MTAELTQRQAILAPWAAYNRRGARAPHHRIAQLRCGRIRGVEGTARLSDAKVAATATVDLVRLLKLRLVVARLGEMDRAGWWNTQGQLGPMGAKAVQRGLPRTHHFAQARSVFAVAAHRCAEVFDQPSSWTLWRLPGEIEEAFDARWEHWVDAASDWAPMFEQIADLQGTDVGPRSKA